MTSRLFAVVALAGCSTSYIPRSPGRIAVTMEDGKLVYVRDGQRYNHGVFGGGLVDAVHGNAAATSAATEFHGRVRSGFVAAMIGFTAMVVGTIVAFDKAASERGSALTPGLVALGGLILTFAGAGYAASAEPYRLDAINIFNDAPAPTLAPPGLDASLPKQSLRMRE